MRKFRVIVRDREFIVCADNSEEAVKKLTAAQDKLFDETLEEKERKAQEWVDYDIKHYGKVSETTKEDIKKMGLDFDKWDNQVRDYDPVAVEAVKKKIKELEERLNRTIVNNAETAESRAIEKKLDEYYKDLAIAMKQEPEVQDSDIKDAGIDPEHYAEYGWKIENDLARECYWEAVEQLAGKLKTEQDYIREIPRLAKQLFEKYVKEIKNEFEKQISSGRSKTSDYDRWVSEQAKKIIEKQNR